MGAIVNIDLKLSAAVVAQENSAPTELILTGTSIDENNSIGDTIGVFTSDGTGSKTYTLTSGTGSTDNASFEINDNQLDAGIVFDYENKNSYSIRVQVENSEGSFQQQFTISINDVNEVIRPSNIQLSDNSIDENNSINDTIGTLSADGDTPITFSLVSGTGSTDNVSFNISGTSLRASESFDYETKNSYSIRVRASNSEGNVEESFTITVNNINDVIPTATNVQIDDTTPTVGDTLTGTYTYNANEGGTESGSTYKWYREGTAISGATSTNYVVQAGDEGFALSFGVTPVGTLLSGVEALSAETSDVVASESNPISNLSISKSGNVYRMDYTHESPAEEENYKPVIDDIVATVSAPAGDTIEIVVTMLNNSTYGDGAHEVKIYRAPSIKPDDGDLTLVTTITSYTKSGNEYTFEYDSVSADVGFLVAKVQMKLANGANSDSDIVASSIIEIETVPVGPTNIFLSPNTIGEGYDDNETVGALTDNGDGTGNYTIVAGPDDDDNASFDISGNLLTINAGLAVGDYKVRINVTDEYGSFAKSFTISVVAVDATSTFALTNIHFEDMTFAGSSNGDAVTSIVNRGSSGAAETSLGVPVLDADNSALKCNKTPGQGFRVVRPQLYQGYCVAGIIKVEENGGVNNIWGFNGGTKNTKVTDPSRLFKINNFDLDGVTLNPGFHLVAIYYANGTDSSWISIDDGARTLFNAGDTGIGYPDYTYFASEADNGFPADVSMKWFGVKQGQPTTTEIENIFNQFLG